MQRTRLIHCTLLTLSMLASTPRLASIEASLSIESELGWGLTDSGLQKADTRFQSEITGDFSDSVRYTVIPTLVVAIDSELYVDDPQEGNYAAINGPWVADHRGLLELTEAYIDFSAWQGAWRVGKQQVVWGQADGLKVLDVVNPQDYREFNLDEVEDARIPLWMVNAEFEIGNDASLQLLLIPDATYSKLADAGTPYFVTSSKLVPQRPASNVPVVIHDAQRPDHELEFGARYRQFLRGWDLSLNYLSHRQDIPAFYQYQQPDHIDLIPTYEPSHLLGGTASNAFGDWVVRMELGYHSHTYQLRHSTQGNGIADTPEIRSVIGLDYQGFSDWFLSYQWFQSTLTDYDTFDNDIIRNRTRMQHTLLARRLFMNDTLELELFALYSDEDNDGQARAQLAYQVNDTLALWWGVDAFYGNHDGQFGQFDDTDRMVIGLELGY